MVVILNRCNIFGHFDSKDKWEWSLFMAIQTPFEHRTKTDYWMLKRYFEEGTS